MPDPRSFARALVVAAAAVLAAVDVSAQVGNLIPLPPHSSVYIGFTRGFHFVAGSDFQIVDLELPPNARQVGDTAAVLVRLNANVAYFSAGNPGPVVSPSTPIQVQAGDDVYVVGNWSPANSNNFTAGNSFGAFAPYQSVVEGVPTTLNRTGVQWDIGDPGFSGQPYLTPTTGHIGRVMTYTVPLAGLYARFDADVDVGASPLNLSFTDLSFTSDPGGVTSWSWDFDGDGVVDSTSQNASFTYSACGTYDVTLTVTDATNPAATVTVVGAVVVDEVQASFAVANVSQGVWQFTDTSSPTPSSWSWDFDGDGVVDDTTANPTYIAPDASSLLDLPTCTLAVAGPGGCFGDAVTAPVYEHAGPVVVGPTAGGAVLFGGVEAGGYFDVLVQNPDGVNVVGMRAGVIGAALPLDVRVYVTDGTHVGKEGAGYLWALAANGAARVEGTGSTFAPELADVTLDRPFYLPPGRYGVCVVHARLGGGAPMSFTPTASTSPYGNADLLMHLGGIGCSSIAGLGACTTSQRLWNGELLYELCGSAGNAAAGVYGAGCRNSFGDVPRLDVVAAAEFGSAYALSIETGMPATAATLVLIGDSRDAAGPLTLPFDLFAAGAPGCLLHTNALDSDLVLAAPGGQGTWSLAVPNAPALQCFRFYQQAAVLDPAANALGFALSNAVAAVVGN